MKVIYFQVKNAGEKLKKIVQIATLHFEKGEPLLILAPNASAAVYLDALLWSSPQESFLPHEIDQSELLALTAQKINVNSASAVLNLCQETVGISLSPQLIYEFEDLSFPETQQSFKKRFGDYRQRNFTLILENLN